MIENDPYLVLFTGVTAMVLLLGSIALSLIAKAAKGSRIMAIALALTVISSGVFIYLDIDNFGAVVSVLGFGSLLIAVWPNRKN